METLTKVIQALKALIRVNSLVLLTTSSPKSQDSLAFLLTNPRPLANMSH